MRLSDGTGRRSRSERATECGTGSIGSMAPGRQQIAPHRTCHTDYAAFDNRCCDADMAGFERCTQSSGARGSACGRSARPRGSGRVASVFDQMPNGMAPYTAALLAHRGPSSLVAQMGSIHRNMPLKGPRCAHPQHCTQPSHIAVACFDTHRLFLLVAACCGCRNYQEA